MVRAGGVGGSVPCRLLGTMDKALLVANRFVALNDGTCLDLATATTVAVTRCTVAADARATLADNGARLCQLWHPALAPYLDFGPLGEHEWFEAVAGSSSSTWSAPRAARADVRAFLDSHDLRSVTLSETSFETLRPNLLAPHESPASVGAQRGQTVGGFGIRLIEPRIVSTLLGW